MVQPVTYLLIDGIADVILQFVGILLEIVELIAVVVVYPVDKFVACGPHRFVRHADKPGHGALAIVLNQERSTPVLSQARQQRHQRSTLDMGTRRTAGELDVRRRNVEREGDLRHHGARGNERWVAHDERRADTLLIGEAALRTQRMFAKEIPVVAEKHYTRMLEHALARQRGEEHPNTLVYRSHHRRAAADLFLGASMH